MYRDSIYAELIPEYLRLNMDVAGEGFAPNVEAILALKPDAVFQWTFDPKVIEPMERVGLKVVGWACGTNQDRRDYLSLSGYTSGRIDRAQAILKTQDESDQALRKIFADANPSDSTSMLVVDQIKDGIRVIANSSQDYSLSGTKNLASDNTGEWWRTIDGEQLLVWESRDHRHPCLCDGAEAHRFLRQSHVREPRRRQGQARLQISPVQPLP
jgi:iron complex transport system substrate-binding protein